jgi:MFS family permease
MTLSLAVWSVMTALCGAASNFWQLLIARFGVGAGEAGAVPPAQSLLADYYPPERRARAIGIYVMSGSAGYVLGSCSEAGSRSSTAGERHWSSSVSPGWSFYP